VTGYDDKGFTTLITPSVSHLQNNAAETPVAPLAADSGASRLFDGVHLQILSIVLGLLWQQAY
jgi:hypothetical protein